MFHLAVVTKDAATAGAGWCVLTTQDGRTLAHELGHNMVLAHGGSLASGNANFSAIYPSIMNYAYEGNPKTLFSAATFLGVNFNPTSVNETAWKGSNNTADLTLLQDRGYLVQGDAVDWNKDGAIQTSPVRARVSDGGAASSGGETGIFGATGWPNGLGPDITDPTLARYQTPAGNRLYLIYHRRSSSNRSGKVVARYSTNVESSCRSVVTAPASPVPCGSWSAEREISGAVQTAQAAGVAAFVQGGTSKMMVVYADSLGRLKSQVLTVDSSGREHWTSPAALPGTFVISGGVSVVYNSSIRLIDVYALSGGKLRRWSYSLTSASWNSVGVAQRWNETGQPAITATAGPGLTWGSQKDTGPTAVYLFGVFPNEPDPVRFARRSLANNNLWDRLVPPLVRSSVRPGLAYQPMPDGSGRFTILARIWNNASYISWTEGNDFRASATDYRASMWRGGDALTQEDRAEDSAMSLAFQPGVDSSPRGAIGAARMDGKSSVWFMPLADGIINYRYFRDQNDYSILYGNLACSLGVGSCRDCIQLDGIGNCSAWR